MQPIFFDWSRPLLRTAAEFLADTFSQSGKLDMSTVILTLPGTRAINRLEELLVEIVEQKIQRNELDPDWFPPKMITVGRLPEMLYPQQYPFADNLTQLFAWVKALDTIQREKPDVLFRIMKTPPEIEDITNRLALARVFSQLHRELAAEKLNFENVVKKCKEIPLTDEASRWDVLKEIQTIYLRTLDEQKLWDVQTSRIFAIDNKEPETYKIPGRTIVLIGTVDMNTVQKKILDGVMDQVLPIVFAPEAYRNSFDQYGCMISQKWKDTPIDISEEQIKIVYSFDDQATELTCWVAEKTAQLPPEKRCAESISLGVPNDDLIPFIRQQMLQAGAQTRAVSGIPFKQTGAYKLLELLVQWVKTQRFSNFADMLRHPGIEAYLKQKFQNEENEDSGNDFNEEDFPWDEDDFGDEKHDVPPPQFLTEADLYYTKYLPTQLSDEFPATPALQAAWDEIQTLFAPFFQKERRDAKYWCEQIDLIFCAIEEKPNTKIRKVLQQIAEIPEDLACPFHALEILELLLQELQSLRVAPPENRVAIEILGWLELPLDDAPILAVTSLNDGVIPSSLTADLFLPDKIRTMLGIEDNDRRLARDAYALSVILGTKKPENILLLASRTAADGSPLLPSRLLFASNDLKTVSKRVLHYFKFEENPAPIVFPGTLRCRRSEPAFHVPPAKPLETPVETMNVTEFRDYIACPYRYYLKHRLKLDTLDDSGEEMDARGFGNLLHETLQRFGESELTVRDSTDPQHIYDFLDEQFRDLAQRNFGTHPRTVIAIQFEQLRTRLRAFANAQAQWAAQGHRIRLTEFVLDTAKTGVAIPLERGEPMNLRGRVDRVDINEQTGQGFILDYKSFKSVSKVFYDGMKPAPEEFSKPFSPEENPDDLQLLLYRYVITNYLQNSPELFSRIPGFRNIQRWQVGYMVLPKDVSQTGILLANWHDSDYPLAMQFAKNVAQAVRDEKFGPELLAKDRPKFTEIYSPICLDVY